MAASNDDVLSDLPETTHVEPVHQFTNRRQMSVYVLYMFLYQQKYVLG